MKGLLNFITAAGLIGVFFAALCADGELLEAAQIVPIAFASCALLILGTYFNLRRRGEL